MCLPAYMHEDFEDLSSIQTKYLWSLHTRSNDIRAELEKNTAVHQEMKQLGAKWAVLAVSRLGLYTVK